MNIDDLHKSVSEMSDEELMEHLRMIRTARRTATEKPAKVAKPKIPSTTSTPRAKKSKASTGISTEQAQALLSSLTPEQKLLLLKEVK